MSATGLPPDLFRSLGLPEPAQTAALLGHSDATIVSFESAPTQLIRRVSPSPYRSAQHARLGISLASATLSTPSGCIVVDPGLWLVPLPEGERGFHSSAIEAIPSVIDRLASISAPHFGHRPGTRGFWPTAPSWSAAVLTRAKRLARDSVDSGLARSLVQGVEQRHKALDSVSRFTLVHGRLTPVDVWLHGDHLTVTGWDRAHYGDPIEDRVPMLRGTPQAVALIEQQLPPLDPAGRLRLEAYLAIDLLERLASPRNLADAGRRLAQVRLRWKAIDLGWDRRSPLPLPDAPSVLLQQQLLSLILAPPDTLDDSLGRIAAGLWAPRLDPDAREALLDRAQTVPAGWIAPSPGDRAAVDPLVRSLQGIRGPALYFLCRQAESAGAFVPWGTVAQLLPALEAVDTQWRGALAAEGSAVGAGQRFMEAVFHGVSGRLDELNAVRLARAAAAELQQTDLLLQGYDTEVLPTVERLAGSTPFSTSQDWLIYPLLYAIDILHRRHSPFVIPDSVPRWFGIGT